MSNLQQPTPHRKKMQRRGRINNLRFLTFSCYQQLQLFGNPKIRDIFVQMLLPAAACKNIIIRAWVVMPEHIHLLIRPTQDKALEKFLWKLKRDFALLVISRWRSLNAPVLDKIKDNQGKPRFWQRGGGFDRVILKNEEEVIQYIHLNPVRRGLVERAADWKWSSLGWPQFPPSTTAPR